jgi:hypothetical protein
MNRIAGSLVWACAALATTTACSVDGDGGGFDEMGGTDDRNMKLGVICTGSFDVSGTFAPGTPGRPTDPDTGMPLTGCWPVGTWTFTATVESSDCTPPPTLLPSYSFRVERVDDGSGLIDKYSSLTNVGDMNWHLRVSSSGQGCEGHFEFGSADGKQYWNMKPLLPNPLNSGGAPSTTLTGGGNYDRFNADGWPWKPAP